MHVVSVVSAGAGGDGPALYLCWCDGTACPNPTTVPFTVCDECKRFGHRALASDGLRPEDVIAVA